MKRIISVVLCIFICLTGFSFGLDLDSFDKVLDKYELDEWGILALYSSGFSVEDKSLEKVDSSAVTTDYEAYILGAIPMKRDVSLYTEKIVKAQNSQGKFADNIDGSGDELVNAHIWGIISLYTANEENYNKEKALEWLKESQNEDGGFPIFTGDSNSDLDLTAMAIVAYSILGTDSQAVEVKKALSFIEENLDKKESSEAVAWYMLARTKLGLEIDNDLYKKLLEYRLDDRGFKHLKKSSKSNYMATWHGILAIKDYENKYSIFDKLHNSNRFKDLNKTDYAYKEIMELINKGIVSGYPDGSFKPTNPVKRAEFAKFLVYGLGLDKDINNETNEFDDLIGHWSNKIVKVAAQKGYFKGGDDKKFKPEDKITGAEVAAILVRVKGLEDKAKLITGQKWYDGYVNIAKENDLLYEDFDPISFATRAQCAEAIYKLMK